MTHILKVQNDITIAAVIEVQVGWEENGRAMHNLTLQGQLKKFL